MQVTVNLIALSLAIYINHMLKKKRGGAEREKRGGAEREKREGGVTFYAIKMFIMK